MKNLAFGVILITVFFCGTSAAMMTYSFTHILEEGDGVNTIQSEELIIGNFKAWLEEQIYEQFNGGMFGRWLQKKGIQLVIDVSEGEFQMEDRVIRDIVLGNMLSNAIKFCSEGDTIPLTQESDGTVAIRDTGMGMEPEKASRIFNVSCNIPQVGTAGEAEGTGIGLAIECRAIADALGYKLKAESAGPGRGSTFYVNRALV